MEVVIPYKVGKSMELIESELGKGTLFKIEWILSNYKNKARKDVNLQRAIDTIVEYIKEDEVKREVYFKALVNGYESNQPTHYSEYTHVDKVKTFDKFIELVKPYFFKEDTRSLEFSAERGGHRPIEFTDSGIYVYHGGTTITLKINGGKY